MPDRRVEALARLARERPSALVHERARDEQRDVDARVLQELVHRVHRRLGVQRVEDRLHDQDVRAAVHESDALLVVRLDQLVERAVPRRRVVHVRRDGRRPVRRADGADDEARLRRVHLRHLVAGLARQARRVVVQLVHQVLHLVVRLGDRRRRERVRADQLRPALDQVLLVDVLDDLRLRDRQQVVVALDQHVVVLEPLRAERVLLELVLLDHRAHGAVVHGDARLEQLRDVRPRRVAPAHEVREAPRVEVRGLRPRRPQVAELRRF